MAITRNRDIALRVGQAVQLGTLTATGGLSDSAVSASALDSAEVQGVISQAYVRGKIDLAYIESLANSNIQFNQEGTLAVATGTARWYAPRNVTINKIEGFLGTAGSGSSTTFATLINGSSNRTDSITAGATTSSTSSLSISVSDGQYLTVNVTAIGTNAADLSVKYYYT